MKNPYYDQFSHLNRNEHFFNRYIKLITIFKERNLSKAKNLEDHHIFPRSFGGTNKKENMVYLTLKEHFIIHHLLWKAFPGTKMTHAFKMMCHTREEKIKITARVFEQLRIEFYENHSKMMRGFKPTEEHIKKCSEARRGQKRSDEVKKQMSESRKGTIYINNGIIQKRVKKEEAETIYYPAGWKKGLIIPRVFTDEQNLKNSLDKKGRIWINNGEEQKLIKPEFLQDFLDLGWWLKPLPVSEESKKKNSESNKDTIIINDGEIQLKIKKHLFPEYQLKGFKKGKLHKVIYSDEVRTRMSNSQTGKVRSEESRKKQAEVQKGMKFMNNGIINKKVDAEDSIILLSEGFIFGRIKRFG